MSKLLLRPLHCHNCKTRYWVPYKKAYLTAIVVFISSLILIFFVWMNFIMPSSNITRPQKIDAEMMTTHIAPRTHNDLGHDPALENLADVMKPKEIDSNIQLAEISADQRTFRTQLYYKRAQNGDTDAQYQLGLAYLNGDDTIQDFEEAAKWFELAAESNHALAQYQLGLIYKTGLGKKPDLEKSYMWLNISAAAGIDMAAIARSEIIHSLSPEQVIQAQRASREQLQNKRHSQ
ncbi:MAG: sel1 repeat family protein [Nitrosomonas sp.]|nr:sel1 repeat family protein [Nitrosomonas sp.]